MPALRILMYCNDHRGRYHTSRTLDIAAYLAKTLEDCSILVLTDLTTVGRFKFPQGVDYIHLPHLLGDDHSNHLRQGLQIEFDSALKIRRKIVQGAIKSFHPDLIMLDECLLDLPYETQKLVSYIADELPQSKIVWGSSDTSGEPSEVIRQWARYEVGTLFDRYANEIFKTETDRETVSLEDLKKAGFFFASNIELAILDDKRESLKMRARHKNSNKTFVADSDCNITEQANP